MIPNVDSSNVKNATTPGENMLNPHRLNYLLTETQSFQEWKLSHPESYLSHFFCQINSEIKIGGVEEIGYFNPASQKITVFIALEEQEFKLKDEEEVFKKESSEVEKLDLSQAKINFEEASRICLDRLPKFFPQEERGDGFVVLQTLNRKALWNFTFISKKLKFLNLKINAENGQIESKECFSVI